MLTQYDKERMSCSRKIS